MVPPNSGSKYPMKLLLLNLPLMQKQHDHTHKMPGVNYNKPQQPESGETMDLKQGNYGIMLASLANW